MKMFPFKNGNKRQNQSAIETVDNSSELHVRIEQRP